MLPPKASHHAKFHRDRSNQLGREKNFHTQTDRLTHGILTGWVTTRSMRQARTSITCINLIGFCPVLLQIMQLNCVQQASISARVNSSIFTKGQHVCVLLLVVRGRHCYAGWVICWSLPLFSSLKMCLMNNRLTVKIYGHRHLKNEDLMLPFFAVFCLCIL